MGDLPAMDSDAFDAGPPVVDMGGGTFFSQELGTLLRLRYNTESYGQDRRGNLDIGTMQVANFQDAIAFFDGQATLSDVNGLGYNLGVGFRWLGWTPFMLEPERITGFNFFADGTSTESGNFFPQVGVGFESLGDMWDLRVNGYIPVGQESQIGAFSPTGDNLVQSEFPGGTGDRRPEHVVQRGRGGNCPPDHGRPRRLGVRRSVCVGQRRSGLGRVPGGLPWLCLSRLARADRGDRR